MIRPVCDFTLVKNFKLDLSQYSNFNAFIERIEADAGVTKALQQEGLEKIGSL
nr:hypothetical protein [Psychrobacter sp. PraFG1]UNK04955.1 hypothetical protein MN210_12785 [Psychrobacter sp. PraFG1]